MFWVIYAFMYAVIVLMTFVGYYSFYGARPPINDADGFINTTRRLETVEITYVRDFEVTKDFVGTVHREVIHLETGYRYEFPGFHREFTKGKYTRTRTLIGPGGMPSGRYVLKTYVVWKPLLSIKEHFREIPEISFKVCDRFELCDVKNN